jgi:disulfide bond formation protein DsbB
MARSDREAFHVATTILVIASVTIAGAWSFEYLGYKPCELCLVQRWPYYIGILLAGLAAGFARWGRGRLAALAFLALALVFAGSTMFGVYHAGVEWGFWPGPSACTGAGLPRAESAADFLAQLEKVQVVRCDAPALRILGLSLAGWNAVVAGLLCALAIVGGLSECNFQRSGRRFGSRNGDTPRL